MDAKIYAPIVAAGYDVFGRSDDASYFYYSDGERIGYAQYDRAGGLGHVASWASSHDVDKVRKYKDFADYQASSAWNKGFRLIATGRGPRPISSGKEWRL